MQNSKNENIHSIPVLRGAATALVSQRELRNKYCTNRAIKTWSFYFLLKSLSTSGLIKSWIHQRANLLKFCQCNEQTFRARLKELQNLGLLTMLPGYSLQLVSYRKAASVLDIAFDGTIEIQYDSSTKGTNVFSYLLRADEFISSQELQRNALNYHLEKNPLLLELLIQAMLLQGSDARQLRSNPVYLQEQLLRLQEKSFKHGSEILSEIMMRRADINRGVKKIATDHNYKHIRSVTYMKRVMENLGIVTIAKRSIISDAWSRRYIPDGMKRKNGYTWLKKSLATQWTLTDQLTVNPKIFINEAKNKPATALAA